MTTCPSCAQENPEGFRYCGSCGASLTPEGPALEERKVVTVLFCDLVGSTAQAEQMDPEDVRALLSSYHEHVRNDLERFGGTVEKFIGDAVMALFGAPAAHEDDPERAVRAALAIREWAQHEGEFQVRIGITTGEALIALGARPDRGEGMASGDVVNTAARLQGAASENGILVDDTTYRATERAISYREDRLVEAKGKAEPLRAWEAVEAKARFGVDVRQISRTPLVGRKDELEALVSTLSRARRERTPQLVTLVGVPGIGKSRLVWELFQRIEQDRDLTRWRQGRSLPYGEGISFWALGEMVKAQAGVLETDDAVRTQEKLHETVEALVADATDAVWLERNLRPLVGLEAASDAGSGSDRRGEAFAAWRRFFEALAEDRALVLVFEDLHFADDGLLDFVDYLVEWASGVPLLVVATARPELLSRRPGWGGGKPSALTLSLSALTNEETAQLVHALVDRPVLDAELQQMLLDRAGGNPLYAEEFARLVEAHGPGEELPLPETVQGLIAARIDGLPSEEKTLLQDGAVLGKVFWLAAAAALSDVERWEAEERLHALERKEFIRRERRSGVPGEVEYAFRHLLVRDVAYGQIPRAARAAKHEAAAHWIESLGRPEDHAEMLAHHYLSALELSRVTDRPTDQIADSARTALREAGERSFALNAFPAAARYYAEALELWPVDDPGRPELLFSLARARHIAADELRVETLEQAREALLATQRLDLAAQADSLLAEVWWLRGNRDRCDTYLDRAGSLVRQMPPSVAKAHVLTQIARYRAISGRGEEAISIAAEALAMADELGLAELQARALNSLGLAKFNLGDLSGVGDLERSIEIALAARSPEAARGYNNLSSVLATLGEGERSKQLIAEAVRVGETFGATELTRHARGNQAQCLFQEGEWNEFLRRSEEFVAAFQAGEPHYMEAGIRGRRARVRLARGDVEGALEDIRASVDRAREVKDPQVLAPAVARAARVLTEVEHMDEARTLADQLLASMRRVHAVKIVDLGFAAAELEIVDQLRARLDATPVRTKYDDALTALLDGDYARAAAVFRETGDLDQEAAARLRAAEQLIRSGRRDEAEKQVEPALEFYRSVEAARYIEEAEALLSGSVASRASLSP